MGYKVSFMDNQVCGVDDFNAILGDIVQEGVVTADFDKTSTYQMSKMNVVTKGKVSQGVSASETSLACSIGMKDGENGVYVAPGLGVFGSGARIKVTESEFVSFGDNTDAYLYAYHDIKNNLAGFSCAGDGFPVEVDGELYILPLCSIIDGVFTDNREYAKANVKVCDVVNTTKKCSFTIPNKDYNGQDIIILSSSDKTYLNFLIFVTTSGIYLVEEMSYGEFRIIDEVTSSSASLSTVSTIKLWDGTGSNYAYLKDLKRDANGNICAKVSSGFSVASYRCILYSSVYEEVSE